MKGSSFLHQVCLHSQFQKCQILAVGSQKTFLQVMVWFEPFASYLLLKAWHVCDSPPFPREEGISKAGNEHQGAQKGPSFRMTCLPEALMARVAAEWPSSKEWMKISVFVSPPMKVS